MSPGVTATIATLCKALRLPTIRRDAARLAEEAARQDQDHLAYLEQLLQTELDERSERRAQRRKKEACFPLIKTLQGFDFTRNPSLPIALIRKLAQGDYIDNAECVMFIGDPGTGKTHLATALGVAAAEQGRKVRFVTAGRLANELIEARDALELSRVIARYARLDLLILDELGYLPLTKTDAELLFQVLSERTELRSIVITTNLPFAEWTTVFPDARLCRAIIDRLTHHAHLIDTGKKSNRLEDAMRRGQAAEVPRQTT